jgi:hypothetical protein
MRFIASYQIPSMKRSEMLEPDDQRASLWLAGNHKDPELRDGQELSVCWTDSRFL